MWEWLKQRWASGDPFWAVTLGFGPAFVGLALWGAWDAVNALYYIDKNQQSQWIAFWGNLVGALIGALGAAVGVLLGLWLERHRAARQIKVQRQQDAHDLEQVLTIEALHCLMACGSQFDLLANEHHPAGVVTGAFVSRYLKPPRLVVSIDPPSKLGLLTPAEVGMILSLRHVVGTVEQSLALLAEAEFIPPGVPTDKLRKVMISAATSLFSLVATFPHPPPGVVAGYFQAYQDSVLRLLRYAVDNGFQRAEAVDFLAKIDAPPDVQREFMP